VAQQDRGAVLVLGAILMVTLLTFAAIAVDLSSAYLQGQRLQRAADAAALAGAQEWQRTTNADGTTPTAEQRKAAAESQAAFLLRQSGFDPDRYDVTVDVTQGRASVSVTDRNPNQVLLGVFGGRKSIVTRAAKALMTACATCKTQKLELASMAFGVSATGRGDGFSPAVVSGDRLYAVNHHAWDTQRTIQCISRMTQAWCPGYTSGNRFPGAGTSGAAGLYTSHISPAVYVSARGELWFAAQSTTSWGMFCWAIDPDSSVNDAPCSDVNPLGGTDIGRLWLRADARVSDPALARTGNSFESVRGAYPNLVGGKLWAMGDDLRMYCVDPASETKSCGSFATATASLTPAVTLWAANGGTQPMDTEVLGTSIYTIMRPRGSTGTTRPADTVIDCFDTATSAPCSGFGAGGAATLNANEGGYLTVFPHRAANGSVDGMCAWGYNAITCVAMDGSALTDANLTAGLITGLRCQPMRETSIEVAGAMRTYFPLGYCHGVTNGRTGNPVNGRGFCWNWATSSSCGTRVWGQTDLAGKANGGTRDYGYVVDGRPEIGYCILGLGDASYWWSFRPEDMLPCDRAVDYVPIVPCRCEDGQDGQRWGVFSMPAEDVARFSNLRLLVLESTAPDAVKYGEINVKRDYPNGVIDLDQVLSAQARSRPKLWIALAGEYTDAGVTGKVTASIDTKARAALTE
jgi:Flp pilus assembly protein TadG